MWQTLYQLSHLRSLKQMMMVSLPRGAWLCAHFSLWVHAPGMGWGRVGGVACPSVWLRGGFPCRVPCFLLVPICCQLCRHGFLPIPLLIGLCFCHRNAKRCRNMSALKSLQPPFTPKAAKEHRSVCFRLLLCNLSKGFIKIIVSPFMRQETVEFKISLCYIVREGST